jgi:hypothetical protein
MQVCKHTAECVMKFDIYPPLTSPTDFSTDCCAFPEDRGPVGGAGGRTERHVAVLARPPCPHDTYRTQFVWEPGGGAGGHLLVLHCRPAPRCQNPGDITMKAAAVDAVLAPAHGAGAGALETGIQLVRRLSPPPPPRGRAHSKVQTVKRSLSVRASTW